MSPAHPTVDLVLPCRDEAAALPALLAAVPPGWGVVVVDNGSIDATARVARDAGAKVVSEPQPGYGAAVHAGLAATRADLVVVCDGDGSIDPAGLAELVAPVAEGRADLVCGRRVTVETGAWPWHARLGNLVLAAVISAGSGRRLHDIAPVRVARTDRLLALGTRDRRFGYPLETLALAGRAGWRIVELPVAYRRRRGGRSKVTGSVRGTARALHDFTGVLLRLLVTHRRGAPATGAEAAR